MYPSECEITGRVSGKRPPQYPEYAARPWALLSKGVDVDNRHEVSQEDPFSRRLRRERNRDTPAIEAIAIPKRTSEEGSGLVVGKLKLKLSR